MSQRDLSRASGVHWTTIAKIESLAYNNYSFPVLIKICKALDTTLAQVFAEANL
jgi:DNA-binding XRE family transcriptional regulator